MQTLYVPKYNLHYRINPKNPCELQWSRKPFGPLTQWQHAMSFKKPIRALDLDDKTKQGVVVLNDSSTYVGSGVRTWGRKFYPAGTRIYSLYAIGESMIYRPTISKLIGQCYRLSVANIVCRAINAAFKKITADKEQTRDGSYNIYVKGTEQELYDALLSNEFDTIAKDINYLEKDYKPKKIPYTQKEIETAADAYIADYRKDGCDTYADTMKELIRYGEYVQATEILAKRGYLKPIGESKEKRPMPKLRIRVHECKLQEELKFKSSAEKDFWNSLKESTYSTTGIPAIDKTFYIITYNQENLYIQLGKTKYENPGWAIDEYGRYGKPDTYKDSNNHLIKTDMVFQFLSATFNSVMQKKFPTLEIPENNWKKCWDRELEGTYQFSPNLKVEFKVRFTEDYGYNNPPRNLLHNWTKNPYEIESSALSVSCYVYTRMSEDTEFSKGFYDLNKIGITALANQIRKLLKSPLKPIQFTTGLFYDYGNMFGSEWDAGNRNFDAVRRETKAIVARLNDELKSKYKRYASHISLIFGMNYRPRPDNDAFNVTYSVPTEALEYVKSELGKTALKLVSSGTQEKTITA